MEVSAATWSARLGAAGRSPRARGRSPWRLDRWHLRQCSPSWRLSVRKLLAAHAINSTDDVMRWPHFHADALGADAADHAVGARIGPYRLLRRARKRRHGRCLAGRARRWRLPTRGRAQTASHHAGCRRDLAARFAHERDILARLEHPHIARFYDAGVTDEGLPYLAMEYVDGQPITKWCDEHRLGINARVALLTQVLDAVQFAHASLVVHRDLKPSNILVTGDGQVRLLDFGIAKLLSSDRRAQETQLTQLGGRALTPDYASPEQIRGETLTIATDVYSLGVVSYELLAGRMPYQLELKSVAQLEQAIVVARAGTPEQCDRRRGGTETCHEREAAGARTAWRSRHDPAEGAGEATVAALRHDRGACGRSAPASERADRPARDPDRGAIAPTSSSLAIESRRQRWRRSGDCARGRNARVAVAGANRSAGSCARRSGQTVRAVAVRLRPTPYSGGEARQATAAALARSRRARGWTPTRDRGSPPIRAEAARHRGRGSAGTRRVQEQAEPLLAEAARLASRRCRADRGSAIRPGQIRSDLRPLALCDVVATLTPRPRNSWTRRRKRSASRQAIMTQLASRAYGAAKGELHARDKGDYDDCDRPGCGKPCALAELNPARRGRRGMAAGAFLCDIAGVDGPRDEAQLPGELEPGTTQHCRWRPEIHGSDSVPRRRCWQVETHLRAGAGRLRGEPSAGARAASCRNASAPG